VKILEENLDSSFSHDDAPHPSPALNDDLESLQRALKDQKTKFEVGFKILGMLYVA
jgi:hypothetical protein